MKYIIMCGANQANINDMPRQLCEVNGERVVERTIRILKELGIDDIAITSTLDEFKDIGVEYIKYDSEGVWVNCFYLIDEPVCYLFGDVYYSYSALYKIVSTKVDDIMFFASNDNTHYNKWYTKEWAEPFAFKVENYERFGKCVEQAKALYESHTLYRCISWELWQVITGSMLNTIRYDNYSLINDYTCDVDEEVDADEMNKIFCECPIMIHATKQRLWYVYKYLIPSLEEQGITRISVWIDREFKGNLQSCIDSFDSLPEEGYTWHIQDDVIISTNFRHHIDGMSDNTNIVCGFASRYDEGCGQSLGLVKPDRMWFSFCCIRISNDLAHEFVEFMLDNAKYLSYAISERKYDDTIFRENFLAERHKDMIVLNYYPNLVNHIDYLIGGSISNKQRSGGKVEALYWSVNDKHLISKLAMELSYDNRQY